jgi:hypothetical protein
MSSALQQAYEGILPERPANIKDRHWEWFRLHIEEGKTYRAIGHDDGVSGTRVGEVVNRIGSLTRGRAWLCPCCAGEGVIRNDPNGRKMMKIWHEVDYQMTEQDDEAETLGRIDESVC